MRNSKRTIMVMHTQRILLLAFLLVFSTNMMAQEGRHRTVVDGDTGNPIANVSIMGRDFTVVTDSAGRFVLPDDCKTLVFSHINYVSYLANRNDLGDTIELYTNDHRLDEIVVFGKPTGEDPLANLNNSLGISKTDAQLISANPNGNLLGLLSYLIPKKWRTSKKTKKKESLKKILEDY